MSTVNSENPSDILEMSDEDFLKMNSAPVVTEPVVEKEQEEPVKEEEPEQEQGEPDPDKSEGSDDPDEEEGVDEVEGEEPEPSKEDSESKDSEDTSKEKSGKSPDGGKVEKDQKEGDNDLSGSKEKKESVAEKQAPVETDYKTLYEQIMKPFKANGKTIELKDPAEAIQLMQMGANFTRKMQDIAPHRKVLLMLENNNLLDEGKLSYLIDLDKKNPQAIQKLIKDAGIDPMEIDTTVEPSYQTGNHRVSDNEVAFQNALSDLMQTDTGKQTVHVINTSWDQASKEALWNEPQVMATINTQRENGMYDRITAEVDRLRTLGKISPDTPFIHAYAQVGKLLTDQNAFADLAVQPNTKEAPRPIATKVATPKAVVKNGDKASAASPTRSTHQKAERLVNPLAMSDDEFLKQMQNRL